jgi:predicted dehydrogenase
MAEAPLRLGVLGAARIAPAALVAPARRSARAVVQAVAARDRARAEAFAGKHGVPTAHGSYEALLADPDVDAVYNPLPNGLHGVWTVRALRAGKHVLCEKPFTANAAEARAVAQVAAESGRVVMEAFHWRYHPLAGRMLEIVRSGELGEIRRIETRVCFPLLNTRDIRYQPSLAGGALMDAGCYALHVLRTLAGEEPRVVSARARRLGPDVDRAMDARFALANGGEGRAVCSMLSRRLLAVSARVEGTGGTLSVLNPIAPQYFHRLRVTTAAGSRRERFPGATSYGCQLEAFVAAVSDGAPPLTGPDDAIANMALIDAVYRAAGMEPRRPTAL